MNTKTLLVLILGLVALTAFACGVDDAPASGASLDGAVVGDSDDVTTPPAQTVQEIVDAPIHSANVLILEMFPPLYRLEIESGLPNGCHSFNDADVSQDGNAISVHVTNTEVTASNGEPVACAMVYGIANNTVELPGSYANGEEFTVDVNGTVVTFIGQSPATSDITDSGKAPLADLIYAGLQRMDPEASRGDEVFQEFFRAYGEAMQVVDGSIQVFTFADEAMAQGAASGVSSDASEIKGVDGSISMPM